MQGNISSEASYHIAEGWRSIEVLSIMSLIKLGFPMQQRHLSWKGPASAGVEVEIEPPSPDPKVSALKGWAKWTKVLSHWCPEEWNVSPRIVAFQCRPRLKQIKDRDWKASHLAEWVTLTDSSSLAQFLPDNRAEGHTGFLILHHQVAPARCLMGRVTYHLLLICLAVCPWS